MSSRGSRFPAVSLGGAALACLLLLSIAPQDSMEPCDSVAAFEQLQASQDPFDRIVCEVTLCGLARQAAESGHLEFGGVSFCLHPDTSPEDAERILRELPTYIPYDLDGMLGFNRRSRWTVTATDGATGVIGDPITITWSLVPDGTYADGGPSDLFAVFDAAWGGSGWMNKIRNAFGLWQSAIGITYVEVSDDGASMPGNPGVLGVRGDVRIGGRSIDGPSNVLAYNYYPNNGDMILDTDDVGFYSLPVNNYANLRNVVAHEHGHGMGLGHVIPTNCTKLMEAYHCGATAFIGPQDDDIRGGMRNYGDPYENNDSNAEPAGLGAIVDTLVVQNLSIDNGTSDVDWYLVTLTDTALTIEVDPIGSSYFVGPDGGSEVWVATDSISDLDVELYDAAGTTFLAGAVSGGIGETEVLTYMVPSPGDYQIFVYRKEGTGSGVQRYTMTVYCDPLASVEIAGGDLVPLSGLASSVYPNPFDLRTTVKFVAPAAGAYYVEVFDVTGRLSRVIEGHASGPGWVEAVWDGRDAAGRAVASGIYFLRVRSGGRMETRRALLVR
jgi:hypothetical protein